MRFNKYSILGSIAVLVLLLVLSINPVLSYQSERNLHLDERAKLSSSEILIAERGCDGISYARNRLRDALDRLRGIEQGGYVRAARGSINSALYQLDQAQRSRRC
ncbi:MAG: hypothetical protein JO235_24125 [Chroococcidiopsidaceae cyanobacterium CP_BM_RX_35]|nr:hypothetical protein [Chroococcidiopsidaceae cyanobacterium CP_BM_RX_35]